MTLQQGTLAGLRVIDFTQIAAGPVCTMMLADRGAEVIKIESPTGDIGRTLGPPFVAGHGAIFMSLNRNKKSAVLNLKLEKDRDIAKALVGAADVVVESFRPGVMAKFGLDYESVSAINPRVIYCSVSAFGQKGPLSGKPGVDGIVQGTSGLMSVTGAANGEPAKVQAPIVDMTTGFLATTAVLDAVMARQISGKGARLDISMYAAGIQLQQTAYAQYLASGELPQPCGSAAPYSAPNEAFPTSDGWVVIAAYQPKRWTALCALLNADRLEHDELFATSDLRVKNRGAMFQALSAYTRQWNTEQLLAALEAADIICGAVNTYDAVVASEPFSAMTEEFQHPEAGNVKIIAPLNTGWDGAYRGTPPNPAPLLGEHTEEIVKLALSLSQILLP